jgi:hypothetical protein
VTGESHLEAVAHAHGAGDERTVGRERGVGEGRRPDRGIADEADDARAEKAGRDACNAETDELAAGVRDGEDVAAPERGHRRRAEARDARIEKVEVEGRIADAERDVGVDARRKRGRGDLDRPRGRLARGRSGQRVRRGQ